MQRGGQTHSSPSRGSPTDLHSSVFKVAAALGAVTALCVFPVSFLGRQAYRWHVYSPPVFSFLVSCVWQINQDSFNWEDWLCYISKQHSLPSIEGICLNDSHQHQSSLCESSSWKVYRNIFTQIVLSCACPSTQDHECGCLRLWRPEGNLGYCSLGMNHLVFSLIFEAII